MTNPENTDGMLDAIAFMAATNDGDKDGRMAIASNCDPANMVDSLALAALDLADNTYPGGAVAWLDDLRARVRRARGDGSAT
ncbi:hypothetical protein [uncultured Gordonia sp.]|uniref:hypothetical protein n=1 Tax=uncultured Gordonia sp. TaxID=198437 RepID=UPI0025979C88|nr:hypothetical protein [uncultured Gordonia sp.]